MPARFSRRALLAAAAGLTAQPAWAQSPVSSLTARPAATWSAYYTRLTARLADAGGGRFDAASARALLERSNAARAAAGAGSLIWHDELARTARAHAADLAQRVYVEHLSPERFDPTDRLNLIGRTTLGSTSENIAYHRGEQPGTPDRLFAIWRRSPPHWTNLLRRKHTHAGFAVVRKADRVYAVGLYARPDGVLAEAVPFEVGDAGLLAGPVSGLAVGLRPQVFDATRSGGRAFPLERIEEAPAGVYQLQVGLPLDARVVEYLIGPLFAWRPA
ncbi:CAP domain-containing protein [Phenylobacterium deserti]|uniref:SCP domain-containing protein n=1 Tax=Phenylobacterium deserti TaxID=1914756 RepID=A0A328ADP2_9CAUL|nr:CAP domain-containing protein [Phenylobacterium deserti]RAK50848.1 hypothetical protein DJ018_16885 [Phenylobacterium deserti]